MEAEHRYSAFDWSRCGQWQTYLSNIFPQPSLSQVLRIRRRWYQRHIDPTLPINLPAFSPAPSPVPTSFPTTQRALMLLELGLFLLAAILHPIRLHALAAGFFADIVRTQGPPQTITAYWVRAAKESELMSVAYCLLFLVYQKGLVIALPVYFGAAIICLDLSCTLSPRIRTALGLRLDAWKAWLFTWQYRLELFLLLPILILGSLLTMSDILVTPLFLYMLSVRLSLKPTTGEAVRTLKAHGDAICRRWPNIEAPWRKAVELCSQPVCAVM